jgi:hypothetical protein
MATDTWTDGTANWDTPSDWSTGLVPGSSSNVVISTGNPQVTASFGTVDSINVSATLTFIDAGASSVTTTVTNSGTITLDSGGGDGGSSLTIGGALTNDGYIQIGPNNDSLSAASTITAASVTNFSGVTLGTIDLYGSSTAKATLDVSSAAGFGAAGTLYGAVNLSSDAVVEFASGEITTIAAGSELSLSGPDAFVADKGSLTSNSAVAGLKTITGGLYLYDGASVTTTGALTNAGTISLDQGGGDGGASLTVGGALTNDGYIQIGPNNSSLSTATTVTAASITNFVGTTYGTIDIYGNDSSSLPKPIAATLHITGAAGFGAAGTLYGSVNLSFDGHVVFAGNGEITTIAGNSELSLSGADSVVADASSPGSNSALTGLKTIDGGLYLYGGASVTTTGALTNSGTIAVDQNGGGGGSSLTVGGALSNSGYVQIGPNNNSLSTATTVKAASIANFVNTTYGTIDIYGNDSSSLPKPIAATLHITGAAGFGAAGTLYGSVNLAYDGHVVFAGNGEITTIAGNSELSLTGADSVVADASSLGSNSALTGLKTITGGLYLYDGASVTTTGALTNTGTISLDQGGGDGASSLTVGGALTNDGYIQIGPNNNSLSTATTITAASIANLIGTTYGTIDIYGNDSSSLPEPIAATLDIAGKAGFGVAGDIEGDVNLAYDGQVVFAGNGKITTIAAHSELSLTGADSVVADASSPGSNSALTGLKTIDGGLYLYGGASVTTTGFLSNRGTIEVDPNGGGGRSSLSVGGALTNDGYIQIGPNNNSLSTATTVTAASFKNFIGTAYGTIDIYGNDSTSIPAPIAATLDITGKAGFGVAGDVKGDVNLAYDGQVVFAGSGKITTIAANSELSLTGADSVVADASSPGSNSALTGLKTITGGLYLYDGASVTTTGALTNTGTISLDQGGGDGGASLTVGGGLTNDGYIQIGPNNNSLSSATKVHAASVSNTGTIDVYGNATNLVDASFTTPGSFTNNGTVNFSDDVDTIAGAVSGTSGNFGLSNGSTLTFSSGVSSGETVSYGGGAADLLNLGLAQSFDATIEDFFTVGDAVDLTNFGHSASTFLYTQTGTDSASWTVKDGSKTAVINFAGEPYTESNFSIVSANKGAGSEIKFIG